MLGVFATPTCQNSEIIRTFDDVENTLARKSPKNFWLFAHLFVPLQPKKT